MSIKEQKEILIQKIIAETDEQMLNSVMHLLDRDFSVDEVEKIHLSDAQKKSIQSGLDDIAAGRIYSNIDARKMIQHKLDSYK